MPWIKATPKMGGTFEFSMDELAGTLVDFLKTLKKAIDKEAK